MLHFPAFTPDTTNAFDAVLLCATVAMVVSVLSAVKKAFEAFSEAVIVPVEPAAIVSVVGVT